MTAPRPTPRPIPGPHPRPGRRAPRRVLLLLGAGALAVAGCTRPPPEAYVETAARTVEGDPVGTDAQGAACLAQARGALPADLPVASVREVFCGGWGQPAARVVQLRGPTDAAQLDALAAGGLWRSWLDQRVSCAPPQPAVIAGDVPARILACSRRVGGWPHLALVAAGPEGPVVADGVSTAAPVMERLAAGQGAQAAAGPAGVPARSATLEIAVRRLAADAFGAADVGRFDQLMSLGRELNQADSFAAAEDAFRAALALQERVLGADSPATATALAHLALNLSNQGRNQEAEALLARAAVLAPRSPDPTEMARVLHYQGIAALNEQRTEQGLVLLRQAESVYAALLPPSMLDATQGGEAGLLERANPTVTTAIVGLSEVRRYEAIAVSRLGRPEEAPPLLADSRRLLRRAGLQPGLLIGRSLRTEAIALDRLGRQDAAARQLEAAARRFAVAAPGERPEALTLFLVARRRAEAGDLDGALMAFRSGAAIVRARQFALPVDLVVPYLDALDVAAAARPAEALALRHEMFDALQLAQRSNTVRFVQQASARLGAAGGDPRVAEAVRRLQDADQLLRDLFAERDAQAGRAVNTELDARIAEAQARRAEAEAEVAAAAPGYRQLLLSSVDARQTAARLTPGEVLITMLIGEAHGWVLALRPDASVTAARAGVGEAEVSRLVAAIRAGAVDAASGRPGTFDPAPATTLHAALLAPLAPALDGAATLIVVPDGALLGIPFGLLLTGPADPGNLAAAPWLIRRHAVVHVPSPQTLVTLRGAGTGSAAPNPWVGFGDFVPPSASQLAASFPTNRCAADARVAQGLVRLPGTRVEVQLAQQLTGAQPQAVKLGASFTAEALLRDPALGQARIVHLATHALLPGELSCLSEPSVVVSAPPGAPTADAAFVKASDLLALKLDADLIILSACNTGGPGGAGGGEALSGLARAFFYTGARGLMVTHWAVDDAAAALTVADSLRRQQTGESSAAALRGAQLLILDEAGRGLPREFAHPFYWAPFALIGDGRRAGTAQTATVETQGSSIASRM